MIKKVFISVLIYLCIHNAMAADILPQNSSEPIEITSHSLRMLQTANKAIFEGKVIAVQGDTKLECDLLTVYFEERKNKNESKPGDEDTKIKKIEFSGNVLIETPTDKATSMSGDYSTKSGIFNLYEDVKLYQKKNILTGDKLVYNKFTGESLLSNNPKSNKKVKALLIQDDKESK